MKTKALFKIEENHGVTSISKENFLKIKDRLLPADKVVVTWDSEQVHYTTEVIRKDGGSVTFSGFALGYNGEGSRGLAWLLRKCGIRYQSEWVFGEVESIGQTIFEAIEGECNGCDQTKPTLIINYPNYQTRTKNGLFGPIQGDSVELCADCYWKEDWWDTDVITNKGRMAFE